MAAVAERIRGLVGGLKAPEVLATLAVNLVPVACVLLFGWSAGILILLYWAENVIVGLFHAVKLLAVGVSEGVSGILTIGLVLPFFLIHYGAFCLGHGLLALFYLAFERRGREPGADMEDLTLGVWRYLMSEEGFVVSLAVIAGFQAVEVGRWLLRRGWRGADAQKLMAEPYGRIIALHVTLIGTAFLLAILGSPQFGVILLALFKTVFEGTMAGRKAVNIKTG